MSKPAGYRPPPIAVMCAALVALAGAALVSAVGYRIVNNMIHADPGAQRTVGFIVGAILGFALVFTVVGALLWGSPPWIWIGTWTAIIGIATAGGLISLVVTRDANPINATLALVGGLLFAGGVITTACTWEIQGWDAWPGWDHDQWWRDINAEKKRREQVEYQAYQERQRAEDAERAVGIKPDNITPPTVNDIYRSITARKDVA